MERLTEEQINLILLKVENGLMVEQACDEIGVDFLAANREITLNRFFARKIERLTARNIRRRNNASPRA